MGNTPDIEAKYKVLSSATLKTERSVSLLSAEHQRSDPFSPVILSRQEQVTLFESINPSSLNLISFRHSLRSKKGRPYAETTSVRLHVGDPVPASKSLYDF
jgi:hypothetical protein